MEATRTETSGQMRVTSGLYWLVYMMFFSWGGGGGGTHLASLYCIWFCLYVSVYRLGVGGVSWSASPHVLGVQ